MAENRYTVYYEGWAADCEVLIVPGDYYCGHQVVAKTKAEVVQMIRQHIKEKHPDGGDS